VLFHPCASLSLHVHHVVKRTCTSQLSIMLGTPMENGWQRLLPAVPVFCKMDRDQLPMAVSATVGTVIAMGSTATVVPAT